MVHRRTTTQRHLGYTHQNQVKRLFRALVDGTACWWCSLPMYALPAHNWDGRKLQGDHSISRANGGRIADRLLHATCNRDRGTGDHDDQRPALTGAAVSQQHEPLGLLLLDWP